MLLTLQVGSKALTLRGEEAGRFCEVTGVSIVDAGGSRVRSSGRQPSGIGQYKSQYFDCGMSFLRGSGGGGGGGGAYARDKNTSVRVCAENAGGAYARGGGGGVFAGHYGICTS